jgi:hypothetical protein
MCLSNEFTTNQHKKSQMKPLTGIFSLATLALFLTSLIGPVQAQPPLDRTVLPIPDPVYEPVTELDARNAKAPALINSMD